MTPTAGRIVNLVMADGQVRPMIVTQVWSDTCVNGTVFLDGQNDFKIVPDGIAVMPDGMLGWATSRSLDEAKQPGTWHWPVKP